MQPAIDVQDYMPQWATSFRELEAVLRAHLGGLTGDIQHVGSTSVPGLAAKPVIDIDIIVPDRSRIPAVIEQLVRLGYAHQGNLGISDREAFRRESDAVPFDDTRAHWPAHHLYVCPADSISLRNHLTLRDALRADPVKAAAYAALKRSLAQRFPYDIDRYVAGKTAFITSVLEAAGFDAASIDAITAENSR